MCNSATTTQSLRDTSMKLCVPYLVLLHDQANQTNNQNMFHISVKSTVTIIYIKKLPLYKDHLIILPKRSTDPLLESMQSFVC